MRAVVLAAGRGERLASLELAVPKPMVPIAGRPLLEYTIALLRRHGVRELFVNLHEKAQAVPAYFAGGENHGVRIHYLIEPELSGTAGPLRNWCDHLRSGSFLVIYGDVLTDVDIGKLLTFHRTSGGAATIAVHSVSDPERCGILSFGQDGRVTNFVEKPARDEAFSRWGNAGIYALEPEVLDYISDAGECDFGRDVFPALLKSGRAIHAYPLSEYLIDVGSPERYSQAQRDLDEGKCQSYVAR